MAPEESLYVIFSGKAELNLGFWYEDSWGCMVLHRNFGEARAAIDIAVF